LEQILLYNTNCSSHSQWSPCGQLPPAWPTGWVGDHCLKVEEGGLGKTLKPYCKHVLRFWSKINTFQTIVSYGAFLLFIFNFYATFYQHILYNHLNIFLIFLLIFVNTLFINKFLTNTFFINILTYFLLLWYFSLTDCHSM